MNAAQNIESDALAPPFAAAISVSGSPWRSPLVRSGPVPLVHPETYLGLLESNDITLVDPAASRIHAVIRWNSDGYVVQDLGSRTGTLVDDKLITGPTPLGPGQRVRIGSTELLFQALRADDRAAIGAEADRAAGETLAGLAETPFADTAVEAAISVDSLTNALKRARTSGPGHLLAAQLPRQYWRIFIVGLVTYIAAMRALAATGNSNLVPLVTLLGAALVPVSFVVFCWEQGAFGDLPPKAVGLAFVSGATIGLLAAALAEPQLVSGEGFWAMLIVALIEETVKAGAALWFLGDDRRYREIDGLVLGAAVGMGFAALETAGYGFTFFLFGFIDSANQGATATEAYHAGIDVMIGVLNSRMALAAFGHGVWTAILCATIWRERAPGGSQLASSIVPVYVISTLFRGLWGAAPGGEALTKVANRAFSNLRVSSSVALSYAAVVLLHTLWNTNSSGSLALYLLYGAIGLVLLAFFIEESIDRAKLGPDAPPPPPLGFALLRYLVHMVRRAQRPVAEAVAFARAAEGPRVGGAAASAGPGLSVAVGGFAATATAVETDTQRPPEAPTTDTGRPAKATTRDCAGCGAALPAGARFCPACGTVVDAESVTS